LDLINGLFNEKIKNRLKKTVVKIDGDLKKIYIGAQKVNKVKEIKEGNKEYFL